jgi:hypothetical protein
MKSFLLKKYQYSYTMAISAHIENGIKEGEIFPTPKNQSGRFHAKTENKTYRLLYREIGAIGLF